MNRREVFTRQELIRLLVPLIIEQVLAVLVGMVDVAMVAAVGEEAVSGVALVDSINFLMINLLSAMATGGAVVCSQYIGRQQADEASRAAGQLLLITTAGAVVMMTVALVGNRRLLEVIFGSAEKLVLDNATTYLWLTALSYPFLGLYNSGAALFRSMGNSRVSMMASIAMNVINIVGNAICIYGLHMGVEGVALPTLAARAFAAILMVGLVCRPGFAIHVADLSHLRPESGMIRAILSVAVPGGIENGIFQFGKIALQSLVSTLGTASIAGFAVASNLVTLEYLTGRALSLGLITIVGQCVGAGECGQAKRYTKSLIAVDYMVLVVICLTLALGSGRIVSLYRLSADAAEMAQRLIIFHSCIMVVWPFAFMIPETLRAGLDARFTLCVSIFSMWAFRIGGAYLFVRGMGLGVMGVWYGMLADWVFRAVVFGLRFCGFEKRARQV